MTTYPLATLAATISDTGISAPSFNDVLESLKATFRSIYGSDVYLEPDSQDGQWLAAIASAINDTNAAAVAVYNAFSPASAQGAGLSSVVKINGLTRQVSSNSTVDVTLVGQAGTVITNGQVGDTAGKKWALPASVTIPLAGQITVTATCTTAGAVTASAGTVTKIVTPTLGWQSVTNAAAAAAGDPVETDALLRQRQAKSTALASQTPFEGMVAAVAAVTGVTRFSAHENDADAADADGIPGHSVSFVIDGGDSQALADAIALKKTPGAYTYGTTAVATTDRYGVPHTIRFFRPTEVTITVAITIKALTGYSSVIGTAVKQAIADYITGLPIGDDLLLTRLYGPANLNNDADGATFEVTSLTIAKSPDTPAASDVVVAFNEAAVCTSDDITLTVV